MEWATLPLKKYAQFSGRSRRKEYWMFVLLQIVVIVGLSIIETILDLSGTVLGLYGPLTMLAILALFIPGIAVSIRRLHDTDRSGWWILLGLVPLVGLVLIVFMVLEGTRGPNQYGEDPKGFGADKAAAVF
jgi:uncharacterized membrane protein YhaH (DUF805 family)